MRVAAVRPNAYPLYKPSGVEWLGDVPEHWDTRALRYGFRVVNGGTPASSEEAYWDGEIHWFTPEDLGKNEGRLIAASRRQLTNDGLNNCGARVVDRGSVLVSTRAPIGHVAVTGVDSCCNQGCRFLVPEGPITADFCYYALLASKEVMQSAGKGTTFLELSAGALASHVIPVPSIGEQRDIAAFLDRETARIDMLVAKKRELIERLKEKRTALISRTVTRGLPPAAARAAGLPENPPLKLTGFDWFDSIPAHWAVLPFTKYVAEKSDYRGKTPDKQPDGVFLVTARNVRMGFIDYDASQEYIAEDDYSEVMRRGLPKCGDILFTTEAPLGNVALVDREDVALAQRIIRFRMMPARFESRFALYAMMADYFQAQLDSLSTGSTAEGLKASKLPLLQLVTPPLSEQITIAAYLDTETKRLDALAAKVEVAIERLQEYRTALITAAVTGKINLTIGDPNQYA